MIWSVLGMVNGKALLFGLVVAAVVFAVCMRNSKEEDNNE